MPFVEWTQLLKELAGAVESRNRSLAMMRNSDTHVTELVAQAIAAGTPSAALARVLANLQPLLVQDRPHVCGPEPIVPPIKPVPVPQQSTDVRPGPPHRVPPVPGTAGHPAVPRYSLHEAWLMKILPWHATTARKYLRRRSPERGIPVPEGEQQGQTVRYTEEELRSWLADWAAQAGPSTRTVLPKPGGLPDREAADYDR